MNDGYAAGRVKERTSVTQTKTRKISYTKAGIKVLRRMPANTAKLIRTKIEAYAQDPSSQANNVKSLKGREGIRRRVVIVG